ncbi:hypothetical protein KEM48_009705 [Puccinia striiformis f. sp. tritici PST-130]|nr:hypothetical protein KEM48_009705 [Puccinia striiformis f. sp. tritici PST-130]
MEQQPFEAKRNVLKAIPNLDIDASHSRSNDPIGEAIDFVRHLRRCTTVNPTPIRPIVDMKMAPDEAAPQTQIKINPR